MIRKIFGWGLAAVALWLGYRVLQGPRELQRAYTDAECEEILKKTAKQIAKQIASITHANGVLKTSVSASDRNTLRYLLLNGFGFVETEYKALTGTDIGTAFSKLFTATEQTAFRNLAQSMSNYVMIANSATGAASYGTHTGSMFAVAGTVPNGQYIGRLIATEGGYVTAYINNTKYWLGASDVVKIRVV